MTTEERDSCMSLIRESLPHIRAHFGDVPVHVDESDDGETLYAVVRWKGKASDASSRLSLFEEGWWLNQMRRAGARVVFTYELI